MFLDNTDIINKLFPVNNSVPLIITMASPAGNTNDVITFATDELVTVDEAIVAATAGKTIVKVIVIKGRLVNIVVK